MVEAAWADADEALLAASLFGPLQRNELCQQAASFVREQGLGAFSVTDVALSTGAGITLAGATGKMLFLKAWGASTNPVTLAAQLSLQCALHQQGFPAPQLLSPLLPFGLGHAVAMAYAQPRDVPDGHSPAVRQAMAETLARLVRMASAVPRPANMPRFTLPALDALWPKPHNALFDFTTSAPGAEWIDRLAAVALAELQAQRCTPVVGHNDWSAQNLRVTGNKVSMVYDWDSLFEGPECVFVGTAAAHFPMTWDIDVSVTPTPEESLAFINEYEAARGRTFSQIERRSIAAAATYARAYKARCEHATDHLNSDWSNSSREALQRYGAFQF